MQQDIYADTYFFINFCMDFLALYLSAKIVNVRVSALRLLLSAGLGAAYAVACLFITLDTAVAVFVHIAMSVLMCLVAYRIQTLPQFLKLFGIFITACLLLGGGIQGLYALTGSLDVTGMLDFSRIPLGFIVGASLVCTLLSVFLGRIYTKTASQKSVELYIHTGGSSKKIKALVDTGSLLSDPISGLPVVITSLQELADFLEPELICCLSDGTLSSLENLSAACPAALRGKLRLIPVRTVSGGDVLPAFVPDFVTVGRDDGVQRRAVIAVDNSARGYGGCQALIPPALAGSAS